MTDEEIAAKKISVVAVRAEEKEAHADFEDFTEEGLELGAAVGRIPAGPAQRLSPVLILSWLAVGIPLAWGISTTVIKALALFR